MAPLDDGENYHPRCEKPLAPSVAEALAMYTRDAARLEFSEHEKGSIEVGKLADLVILDRNPLDGDPADIGSLIVEATMIRGVMVHDIRQSGSISA